MNYILFLGDKGNVGIGTNNPQYKLSVNSEILAKGIKASTKSSNWPDFVFTKEHKKMGLTELEMYINANNHLPDMPPATDAGKEGAQP